jgi:hypothetical protein
MSDDEGFLRRWSRRKRERTKPAPSQPTDDALSDAPQTAIADDSAVVVPDAAPSPEALFDLTKLPPIESISAATDIRPFLARGVPAELTRAALRRAWTTDPAIRDFIGLAENQWDFTAPDGVPGFGSVETEHVRQMLAGLFAEREPEPTTPGPSAPRSRGSETPRSVALVATDPHAETRAPNVSPELPNDPTLHRSDENAAAPRNEEDPQLPVPRRHGSALPE